MIRSEKRKGDTEMYYIMGEPHGNAKTYFALKDQIEFSKKDEMYILGDVLGGNSKHPEECIKILEDIMQHDNIHLLLGDFEYSYVMSDVNYDEREKEKWRNRVREHVGGAQFLAYMDKMTEQERKRYVSYLIECNMTKLLEIEGRQFYLVHGAPVVCEKNGVIEWQEKVTRSHVIIGRDYRKEVLSDPDVKQCKKNELENLFIVCGHAIASTITQAYCVEYAKYMDEDHSEYCRVFFQDNIIAIHCGCQADKNDFVLKPTLACMKITATGCNIKYANNLF